MIFGMLRRLLSKKSVVQKQVESIGENKPNNLKVDLSGITFGRSYRPNDDEIFYHYCSVETFKAIVETKTIRFSDINMMNDYAEAGWGYKIFIEAANKILDLKENVPELADLDKNFLDYIDEIVSSSQLFVHPIVACFSRNPDVLSQWRAYADNGRGFSVGFSGRVLKNLPVNILEVEYDRDKQVEETRNAIGAIYMQYLDRGKSFDKSCRESAQILAACLYAYKNPGFSEEDEIRCIHLLDVERINSSIRLVDKGGTAGGVEVEGEKVQFRVNNGGIVAYIDLPFDKENAQPLISRLFAGPDNSNAVGNVEYLLGSKGFELPEISKSQTTFRV